VAYERHLNTNFIHPDVDRSTLVVHKSGVDTISPTIKDTTTLTAAGLPALVWKLSDRLDTLGFLPFQWLW
jgi:hypothetical protein